ncbi:Peptide methionine sulfoxide reductase MsrB [Candidatus Bealeia paramacronuclearis]|uniref:peptide-methionine (R)-S-oxide reductase n=1 Tax=Candidatus Bealeia paramacronuclearis TaxID=1921001 RepID=A0ABZ2C2D7_9PROT|nr:Peptide methionine sulfoxide reductase MsrB [Candidatus Bealeia paramacronuclearis]
MTKTPEDWKKVPEDIYSVCWLKRTETPFSGKYNTHYDHGTYLCACCDQPLFISETKYDSGSGWPSFWDAITPQAVVQKRDISHGLIRTEILGSLRIVVANKCLKVYGKQVFKQRMVFL